MAESDPGPRWVDTWACTPQLAAPDQLPPAPFTAAGRAFPDCTLRQTVRVTAGGEAVRVRFSNAYGDAPLRIAAGAVAVPAGGRSGVPAVEPGSARPLRFAGATGVLVPPGGEVESDPVALAAAPGSRLSLTVHLTGGVPAGQVTSHPGSRTTSYLCPGDEVGAVALPGATGVDHWYFLSGVRVLAPGPVATAVMVGDSLTDGRGTTTNGDDRWPDLLFDRLQRDPATGPVAVLNHAAGGTRLGDDDPAGRLVHRARSRTGLRWVLVFKGVNDLGTAAATHAAQQRAAGALIEAYERIIAGLRPHGVKVYGATLLPFGHAGYDDPAGHREAARQRVNAWVRGSGRFDEVVDFDRAVRDPADPRRLAARFDCGDHLHLSPAGYRALAEAVPLRFFQAPATVDGSARSRPAAQGWT
ncbi:MAG TPA: SGNH/GDSL hydrolase family protein [Natronosporangium sp.]|nr:SGNH/GDSL hydrolase family protein [Natronosporangium sp.]